VKGPYQGRGEKEKRAFGEQLTEWTKKNLRLATLRTMLGTRGGVNLYCFKGRVGRVQTGKK